MMSPIAYAIIRKSDGLCIQVNQSTNPDWVLNDDNVFNMRIDPTVCLQYLDKYYHDGQWWERTEDTESAWMPKY